MIGRAWLHRLDWLWMIIGGFYLVAYLFWYIPVLARVPGSVWEPLPPFPWHWPLDFLATGIAGTILLILGFVRALELVLAASPAAASERD